MSDKVVKLGTRRNDMVETVEDLLARVKNGDIADLAIACVSRKGNILSAVITDPNMITLLGAVSDLRRQIEDKIER